MRVGLLTSWRTQCGIAEYSSHLARALTRVGAEVYVLGSMNDDTNGRHLPADHSWGLAALRELPVFDVQAWRVDRQHRLLVDPILAQDLDVLHVQYEVLLYHREKLRELLARFEGVKAVTWHDNCIPPDVPTNFDVAFRHREDTGPFGTVIPFGIEQVPPVVKTFGLGRSRADVIAEICERNGWRFEQSFGDQRWLSQSELHEWLREADVIVLWYPPNAGAGSSQAARTALATRRPLIVNTVEWFADLPWGPGATAQDIIHAPDRPEELENALRYVLHRQAEPYIEASSWDRVANLHLSAYTAALCEKPGGWAKAAAGV